MNKGDVFIIVFVIGALIFTSWIVYQEYFSEESKREDKINEDYKSCMNEVALNYCNNISKEFRYVYFDDFIMDKEIRFLSVPTYFTCKEVRRHREWERYDFLEEEINICKGIAISRYALEVSSEK